MVAQDILINSVESASFQSECDKIQTSENLINCETDEGTKGKKSGNKPGLVAENTTILNLGQTGLFYHRRYNPCFLESNLTKIQNT